MAKEDWKETGKSFGTAAKGFAKTFLRSGKEVFERADEWAEKKDDDAQTEPKDDGSKENNVFNDGSWREAGKDIGTAFKNLGKSLVGTGKEVMDKADEKVNGKD